MTEKNLSRPRNKVRRKLIKSLGVTGGLLATGTLIPKNWTNPLVEYLVLDAQAGKVGDGACAEILNVSTNPIDFTCGTTVGRSYVVLQVDEAHGCRKLNTSSSPYGAIGGKLLITIEILRAPSPQLWIWTDSESRRGRVEYASSVCPFKNYGPVALSYSPIGKPEHNINFTLEVKPDQIKISGITLRS